ncbi:GntR family transcriptional regulator [Pelagibius litoralis]|uniref:GntR family transcriptional regulator n=2 Tax=Pelagibius litoralis TaxID=374515 RepID=A0A967CBV4_9PROT|nr:GntR family transcriptional regulator [Pelagibius litoralis]
MGEPEPAEPLTKSVANRLRDMIAQDALPAGERIRERALAEQLQVSRTPLREALKVLATEGLVELFPNRGAVVSDPDPTEVQDLLQVLGVLEGLGGELACARAKEKDLDEVQALHYEMLAAYARKDRLTYFKVNQQIHKAIVAISGNASLIETHARINARLYRVRYRSNSRNTKWDVAIEEHEAILAALRERDAAALSKILRSHLGSTWTNVSEGLVGGGEETTGG